jgi:hypothetical protein
MEGLHMQNGTRVALSIACITVLLIVGAVSTSVGQTSMRTTDALAREADLVAVCKVTAATAEWDGTKSRIVTRVTMAVGEYLKGGAGSVITVTAPGGEVDGVGEWYSHSARFTKDEDVVVFAGKDPRGDLRITGGAEGKISITKDGVTGRPRVSEQMTLDDLKSRIRTVVQEQELK